MNGIEVGIDPQSIGQSLCTILKIVGTLFLFVIVVLWFKNLSGGR
jgi:hypothetical protein